jgi:hypothetical protein
MATSRAAFTIGKAIFGFIVHGNIRRWSSNRQTIVTFPSRFAAGILWIAPPPP